VHGEDLPLLCVPALSPSPWLDVNARRLEEEKPTAAQLPANKRVRGQSRDSMLAPAAHPGLASVQCSRLRGKKVMWYLPW